MDIHCGLLNNVDAFTVWGSESLCFEFESRQNTKMMADTVNSVALPVGDTVNWLKSTLVTGQLLARGVRDGLIYFKKINCRMNLIMRMQKAVIDLKVKGTRNNFSCFNVGNYLSTLSYPIYNSPLIIFFLCGASVINYYNIQGSIIWTI